MRETFKGQAFAYILSAYEYELYETCKYNYNVEHRVVMLFIPTYMLAGWRVQQCDLCAAEVAAESKLFLSCEHIRQLNIDAP